jgi:[ribosomal protein S5]-alanine N-acetyltransferase
MDRNIVTDRLILRVLQPSDAQDIADQIDDIEIASKLARVPHPYTYADAIDFLGYAENMAQPTRLSAICLTDAPDRLRGIISYEALEVGTCEFGYWLAKPLWGQGVMTEAARAMVAHAFEVGKVDLLKAGYFESNPASGKVLQRAGFESVGHKRIRSLALGHDVPSHDMQLSRTRWLQNTLATY